MKTVPLLDLSRQHAPLRSELDAAVARVLDSERYIMGEEVEGLEAECGAVVGARHAIAVSSGTDALLLALMALGVGRGDEVVCPTFTFFATAGVIWRLGATPVFVDVEDPCLNLDPARLAGVVGERTKAIIPVHLYGQCADLDPILELARARGVAVVEDAAQAFGATYRGRPAGSMGTFGCFSFFPSKNLGGFGDGGLVTTDDDELAERARRLRVHGGGPKYYHSLVGANFRMDALQCALLRVKLPHLPGYVAARRRNAARYDELFRARGLGRGPEACGCGAPAGVASSAKAPLVLPMACRGEHDFNQYVVRVTGRRRDALRDHLLASGIGCEIYYPVPLHLQECFATLGGAPGDCPVAEAAAREVLALPIFPELESGEIEAVVEAVAGFYS